MSEATRVNQEMLLAAREMPEGKVIERRGDLPYNSYRSRFYHMQRYYLRAVERRGARSRFPVSADQWYRTGLYVPYTSGGAGGMEALAVELEHADVHRMKRTAHYPGGTGRPQEDYRARRFWAQGTVRVEMVPTEGVLRPDGFYDGDTLLTVTYTPASMVGGEGGFQPPQPIQLVPPTSLAVLRDSQYFADEVWEAARNHRTPWDLAREE